jgi:hypothetical protein
MATNKSGGVGAHMLRIVVMALVILAVFALTALVGAGLSAGRHGTEIADAWNLYVGIFCGLVAWSFVVIFHIKRDTLEMPIQGRGFFLDKAKTQLQKLGYDIRSETHEEVIGTPGFHAILFGGDIHVRAVGRTATLTGPKVYLERLRKDLRLQNQVDVTRQAVIEGHRRDGERRLFRVHISLRFGKDHWDDVHDEVISLLSAEGADVTCELTLQAQSGAGIRDGTVEEVIRPWLVKQGIPAEIRKEETERCETNAVPADATTAVRDTAQPTQA